MSFMQSHGPQTYAVLRIVAGFLFLCHGTTKILGFPGVPHDGTPEFVRWVAGGIEMVAGAFVMVGFLTRPAAFVSSGLMAAAYWMAHGTQAFLPINNRGELAVLYCFLFLYVSAHGPGIWSIDARNHSSASPSPG